MNSKVSYAALLALTLLIVLRVLSIVNATPTQNLDSRSALVADGTPAPPPAPNPWLQPVPDLVADGTPAPPPAPNPWLLPQYEQIAA